MREKLEELMSRHGDGIREAARKSDLSESAIQLILSGKRGKQPSFRLIEKIARGYGVSLDFFSSETPHMEPTA
ncbi:MAG: helix-turn-helix transcriptional regulator [Meiothermus sp.]|nr:helix-turn-helix transcriptional regulator [Meiothermus sp.]